MRNNVLPNLSEWFEVPVGATILAYTRYAIAYSDGTITAHKDGIPFLVEVAGRFFTEHKIEAPKKTLEDVIRDAGTSATDIARAVGAFCAEQNPGTPRVIIDNDTDLDGPDEDRGVWQLNAGKTYDFWFGTGERSDAHLGFTREQIERFYGIQEERY